MTTHGTSAVDSPGYGFGENIATANRQLLESGRFSDLTIVCSGQEFKVHKTIVCMQSAFFMACCEGGFKVR